MAFEEIERSVRVIDDVFIQFDNYVAQLTERRTRFAGS